MNKIIATRQIFSRLTIQHKLFLAIAGVFLLTLLFGLIAISAISKSDAPIILFDAVTLRKLETFPQYKDALNEAVLKSFQYVVGNVEAPTVTASFKRAEQALNRFTPLLEDNPSVKDKLVETFIAVQEAMTELMEIVEERPYATAQIKISQDALVKAHTNAIQVSQDVVDRLLALESVNAVNQGSKDVSRTSRVSGLLFVLFMLLLLALSYLFSRFISRPINKMREAVEEVAQGNFARAVDIVSEDEIGQLAKSLNTMVEQVRQSHGNMEAQVNEQQKELKDAMSALENKVKERTRALEQALQESGKK